MNDLTSKEFTDFKKLYQLIVDVKQKPENAVNLITTSKILPDVLSWAESSDELVEGDAKALLQVAGISYNEECLTPETTSGSRLAKNTEVEIIEENTALRIYPNPASTILYVDVSDEAITNIQVLDVTGKLMLKQTITQNAQIDINALQNGIYIVNLIDQTNNITTKKVVIIK